MIQKKALAGSECGARAFFHDSGKRRKVCKIQIWLMHPQAQVSSK